MAEIIISREFYGSASPQVQFECVVREHLT